MVTKSSIFVNAIAVIVISGCGLRDSDSTIQARLLSETPIGSTQEFVVKYLVLNKYKYWINEYNSGMITGDFIRAELGSYGLIFDTNVTAFWEFDKSDSLRRIVIWKTTDSL